MLSSTLNMGYFTQLYVMLRVLRDFNKCQLPIEVLFVEHPQIRSPPSVIAYLRQRFSDVSFINMGELKGIPPNLSLIGFHMKIFALVYSPFEEILMLDTDNYPIVDPSFVFSLKAYKKHGAVFWPDWGCQYGAKPQTWDMFELPHIPGYPDHIWDPEHWFEYHPDPDFIEIQGG